MSDTKISGVASGLSSHSDVEDLRAALRQMKHIVGSLRSETTDLQQQLDSSESKLLQVEQELAHKKRSAGPRYDKATDPLPTKVNKKLLAEEQLLQQQSKTRVLLSRRALLQKEIAEAEQESQEYHILEGVTGSALEQEIAAIQQTLEHEASLADTQEANNLQILDDLKRQHAALLQSVEVQQEHSSQYRRQYQLYSQRQAALKMKVQVLQKRLQQHC